MTTAPPSVNPTVAAAAMKMLHLHHWAMLVLALAVVVGAFVLQLESGGGVATRWQQVRMPPLCMSRAVLGFHCPGCGLTRSIVALAGGDWRQSLEFHRLGWLMALVIVAQIPYRVFALAELRRRVVTRSWPLWLAYALVAALLVNWLLKVSGV